MGSFFLPMKFHNHYKKFAFVNRSKRGYLSLINYKINSKESKNSKIREYLYLKKTIPIHSRSEDFLNNYLAERIRHATEGYGFTVVTNKSAVGVGVKPFKV